MKAAYILTAAAALVAVTAHAEPKKPVTKWSCEEFLAVQDDFQPKVIYWSSAKTRGGVSIIDIDGAEKVVPMVIDDCKKEPKQSFMSKVKNAWKKVEADARALGKKL